MREQLSLVLAHLKTPIQLTAVYFRAHVRKSTIHHLSRCHRRSYFWGISFDQREQIFFDIQMSQSHDKSQNDLVISVGAQHQWFPEQ